MQTSLYVGLYLLSLILLIYALNRKVKRKGEDSQLPGIAAMAAFIIFIVLGFMAPNVGDPYYDPNTDTIKYERLGENGTLEAMVYFWVSIGFSVISLIQGLYLIFSRPMEQAIGYDNKNIMKPPPLKIPGGFGNGGKNF